MRTGFCAVLLLVSLAACGGGKKTVTAPDTQAGSSILSGYDDSPVAAQIETGTDGLRVSAAGFLTLDTVDRHRPIRLWPNDSRMTLQNTFQYIYSSNEFNTLHRPGDSTAVISVFPTGALASGEGAAAVAKAIAENNALLADAGLALRYQLGGNGLHADVVIDPADPIFQDPEGRPGAVCYGSRQGDVMVSARVVIYDLPQALHEPTIKHELAHILGLWHSVHPGPMMNSVDLYQHTEWTELDRLYVKMLFMRLPGTKIKYESAREIDRQGVTASSVGDKRTEVIVCRWQR